MCSTKFSSSLPASEMIFAEGLKDWFLLSKLSDVPLLVMTLKCSELQESLANVAKDLDLFLDDFPESQEIFKERWNKFFHLPSSSLYLSSLTGETFTLVRVCPLQKTESDWQDSSGDCFQFLLPHVQRRHFEVKDKGISFMCFLDSGTEEFSVSHQLMKWQHSYSKNQADHV